MKILGLLIAAFIATGAVTTLARAASDPKSLELERATEELRSSDREWRREEAAWRAKRLSGKMAKIEAEEYAEFVAGLHRKKLEDCEIVRKLGGNEALKGFDCVIPAGQQKGVLKTLPKTDEAKTEGEKIGSLEDRLKRLEAELDQQLLQKQQDNRENQRPLNSGGGPGGKETGGGAKKAGASGAAAGEPGRQGAQPPGNRSAATSNSKKRPSGNYDPGAGPGLPKDEKSEMKTSGSGETGNDDDIVMRQIREAAERETDPVMKEKLWNEYRKLKTAQK